MARKTRQQTTILSSEYARLVRRDMTEEAFLQQVRAFARTNRCLVYHTRQVATCFTCGRRAIALGSDRGFPDLVILTRDNRLIVLELKTVRNRSGVTAEQREWIESFAEAAWWAAVVTPLDLDTISAAILGTHPDEVTV